MSHVLLNTIFQRNQSINNTDIVTAIEQRDKLVSDFLKMHEKVKHIQQELAEIESRIKDQHQRNRSLMADITTISSELSVTHRQEQADPKFARALKRAEEELEREKSRQEILRNVLQGLLLESGVQWVDDEHWLKVMLMLGET
ncbi:uncharacterized protein VTP21DRAFT_8049 [Calcarisporiella thermophila]|uniref:uncharacterized protein n=1 Tax=Calcarisporiella thermophila TaxID=911321 RepID=UPI003743F0A1